MNPDEQPVARASTTPPILHVQSGSVRFWAILGALLMVGSLTVAVLPGVLAQPTPTVTVAPTAGIVGSSITVGGSNFIASTTVVIDFNDSAGTVVLCAACAVGTTGGFSDSFSVPAAPNGTATVSAFEVGATASAPFEVVSHQTLSRLTAAPGNIVDVTGTGFDGFASVAYSFGPYTPGGNCNGAFTSNVGGFACAFRVPHEPYGTYLLTAADDAGNFAINSVYFTLVPGGYVAPGAGVVGSLTTVSVDGFPAFAPLSIIWDPGLSTAQVLAAPLTDGTGSATTAVTVPVSVAGAHTIQVFYSSSVMENFTFTVLGSLRVTPNTGYVGEPMISAFGEGLPATSLVNLLWDSGTAVASSLGNVTTLANGTFTLAFTAPSASRGLHEVSASIGGTTEAIAFFTIDESNLTLFPTTGPPGGVFSATMVGFAATSASNVIWDLGLLTQSLLGNGTTSDRGALTLTGLHVPAGAAPGPHVVTATDASGDRATATFVVGPWLTLTPGSGPVNSTVMVTGSTFPSGHVIDLVWNSTTGPLLATVAALPGATGYPYGNFTATITIPVGTFGPHSVYALVTGTSTVASAAFSIIPSLRLSVVKGPVGTPVAATAEGLAPMSLSTLSIDGTPTGLGGTSNVNGTAVFSFLMPPEPAGLHALVVTDAFGDATNVANFTVVPMIAVTPAIGYPGEPVLVNLTGFAAGSQVTIAWDGNGTATGAASAADGSALDVVYSIPSNAAPGDHNLSAWDLAGNIAPAVPFMVVPLPIPVPTAPLTGAMFNHSVVPLSWNPVPNGSVSYTVEVSSSADFSSGTVTMTGIAATVWSPPALPDGTYYWRVEAVAPGGGTAGFSAVESYLIDTVAPFSTVGSLPSTVVGMSLSIPYTAVDPAPGSGVEGVELLYSVDGGHDWVAYENGTLFTASPIAFQAPVPGLYEFQTVAVDRAGNHQLPGPNGQASVVFDPLAVTPNYAPYVFLLTLAVLSLLGAWFLTRYRRPKPPTEAPRPWVETKPTEPPSESPAPPPSSGRTEGP